MKKSSTAMWKPSTACWYKPMIITVTMNPAIDKTIEIPALAVGGLNRITSVTQDAGGKGINVSKTIKALGGTSIATGFLGGKAGKWIANELEDLDIQTDFIFVDGETRTNTKVLETGGQVTELNESGVVIGQASLNDLLEKLEGYAKPDTLFVLSGSVPQGVPKDIYQTITQRVRQAGGQVLVDADGELFKKSLPGVPNMIKPNREELAGFLNKKDITEAELVALAKDFLDKGIDQVSISMGGNGAMIVTKEHQVRCPVLNIQASSTVGAGDAMVAAMAHSWAEKLDFEDMVALCMATSAGACTTVGTKPPSLEVVNELKKQVTLCEIGV